MFNKDDQVRGHTDINLWNRVQDKVNFNVKSNVKSRVGNATDLSINSKVYYQIRVPVMSQSWEDVRNVR